MASFVYNLAANSIAAGDINLDGDTLKIMLVNTSYSANRDQDYVDNGTANDAANNELTCTGYTGGFAGADRQTLGSKTFTSDDTNDRCEVDCADITWTALGNGTNDTIQGAIVIKEVTNDAASLLICFLDVTNTTTNGGDVTLAINTEGFMWLNTA